MSNGDPLSRLNPSIVGQAEKAHSALLKKVLAGTTLDERQWITVQVALGADHSLRRSDLVARVSAAAKYEPSAVEAAIAALVDASLLERAPGDADEVAVTAQGRAFVSTARAEIRELVGPAYASVPPEDLATAASVLTSITAKLSDALGDK